MLAKIKDYGVSLTKAGAPQIVVKFETLEGKNFTWWGSLNAGEAREITIKSLMKMGWDGEVLDQLASGIEGGALNHVQEYDLGISTKPDLNGKPQERVQWINLPGESSIKGKLDTSDALAALKGLGSLKGDILAVKKTLPQSIAPKAQDEAAPF